MRRACAWVSLAIVIVGCSAEPGPCTTGACVDATAQRDAALLDGGRDVGSLLDAGILDAADAAADAAVDASIGSDAGPTHCTGEVAFSLDWSDATSGPTAIALGDLDGDGRDELAVGYADARLRVVRRVGVAWSVSQSFYDGASVGAVAGLRFGDMDGDGDLDLAIAHADGGPLRLLRNDAGVLVGGWTSSELEAHGRCDLGDLDGDGDLDLATAITAGGGARVYRNDGAGGLAPAWIASELGRSLAVRWADLDGDSDADLVVAMDGTVPPGGPMLIAYRNDGGTLSPAWMIAGGMGDDVDVGDFDGDGAPDLALADTTGALRTYRNAGAFSFTEGTSVSDCAPASLARRRSAIGGVPTLAASCGGAGARVLQRVGDSWISRWTDAMGDASDIVAWGDVDGDGFTDLAVASETNSRVQIYRGLCRAAGSTVLRLDGDGDGVLLPRNPAFGDVGKYFTIEMWIRPVTQRVSGSSVLFDRRAGPGDYALVYSSGGDGRARWILGTDADASVTIVGASVLAVGEWHHVAGVVDGRDVRLYVDGHLEGTAVAPDDINWRASDPRALAYSEYATFVGYTRAPADGGSEFIGRFIGDIDDVRVSHIARYAGSAAAVPIETVSDPDTVGLWTFEEAGGPTATDTGPTGALSGTIVGAVRITGGR